MIVLRFSPVSSGLFSFRMSNTRSAGQAHCYEHCTDISCWAAFSDAVTDFDPMTSHKRKWFGDAISVQNNLQKHNKP